MEVSRLTDHRTTPLISERVFAVDS